MPVRPSASSPQKTSEGLFGTAHSKRRLPDITSEAATRLLLKLVRASNEQEKQMLWNEALKEIGNRLRRDLRTEERMPDRMHELIAQPGCVPGTLSLAGRLAVSQCVRIWPQAADIGVRSNVCCTRAKRTNILALSLAADDPKQSCEFSHRVTH